MTEARKQVQALRRKGCRLCEADKLELLLDRKPIPLSEAHPTTWPNQDHITCESRALLRRGAKFVKYFPTFEIIAA